MKLLCQGIIGAASLRNIVFVGNIMNISIQFRTWPPVDMHKHVLISTFVIIKDLLRVTHVYLHIYPSF